MFWQQVSMCLGAVGTLLICLVHTHPAPTANTTLELRMPNVQPQTPDDYLCYPTELNEDTLFITGFEPHAEMNVAHHMLLYGCLEPGQTDQVWSCGEMAVTHDDDPSGPVCAEGAQILYAWAMDAPDLKLPKDVAFKVGRATSVKWLVLQVHYKDVSSFTGPDAKTDNSGITLDTTTTPQPKTAAVYLLGTGGEIPAHSTVYMETACTVYPPVTMHPFAYRAHTHTHGEVVSGYRVHDGKWEEIGRVSPKLPQMFYDVTDPDVTVENGDILAARCTMRNDDETDVEIGATQNDEMCNLYVMYWVEGDQLPDNSYCFTDGPPMWSWEDLPALEGLEAPNDASVVPGADKVIEASAKLVQDTQETVKLFEEALQEQLIDLLATYEYYDTLAALYENDIGADNPLYNMLLGQDYYDMMPPEVYADYYANMAPKMVPEEMESNEEDEQRNIPDEAWRQKFAEFYKDNENEVEEYIQNNDEDQRKVPGPWHGVKSSPNTTRGMRQRNI